MIFCLYYLIEKAGFKSLIFCKIALARFIIINSQGQPVTGTSIEGFQVREMYRLYKVPVLNRDKQK